MRALWNAWRIQAWLDTMLVTRDPRLFLVWAPADLLLAICGILGTLLLAERFDGLGDWSRGQVVFLMGYAALARGLSELFFNYNVLWISRRIGRGQLDHTLIQPRPLWLALLTEGFMPISMLPGIAPGVFVTAWGVALLGPGQGAGWWALFALNLAASGVVIVALSFAWGSLAFRAPAAAEEISSSALQIVNEVKSFPLDSAGFGLRAFLLTAAPVGFVAWAPCRALLGIDPGPFAVWLTPLAALGFGLVAVLLTNRGLKHYMETGARRYADLGHRR